MPLKQRLIVFNREALPISDGMLPVSELKLISIVIRVDNKPMEVGTLPVKEFTFKSIVIRFESDPTELGRVPPKEFLIRLSFESDETAPMLDEMLPPARSAFNNVILVTSPVTGSQYTPVQDEQIGVFGTRPLHDQPKALDAPVAAAKSHIAKAACTYTTRLGVNYKTNNMGLTVAARVLITQIRH